MGVDCVRAAWSAAVSRIPHFISFRCYRRQPNFFNAAVYDLTSFFLPPFRQKAGERMGHPAQDDKEQLSVVSSQ
jgi:hypothetical protein